MITEETASGSRIVTIERPDSRNALTRAMVLALVDAVRRFQNDASARVLILTGAGDRAFCAGADIKEMAALRAAGEMFEPVMPALYETLLQTSKPTVAALNGDAVGGGLEIALACDVRIASRNCRLGLPEALWGMVPRFGVLALARMASPGLALEMAISGALIPADLAARFGLVNRVVAPEAVRIEAATLAESLCRASPSAIAAIKQLLLGSPPAPMRSLPSLSREVGGYDSSDWAEGISAFADKRPPSWHSTDDAPLDS